MNVTFAILAIACYSMKKVTEWSDYNLSLGFPSVFTFSFSTYSTSVS